MPIRNKGMTIDAKLQHFIMPNAITLQDAAADHYPTLFDRNRDIIIVHAESECTVDFATDDGVVNLGTAADADFIGIITTLTAANAGDFTAVASILNKRLVKNTPLRISHIDKGTSAGDVMIHIWWYYEDEKVETETP